jgi:uncharacterized membrane protein HdeD (DUF308 family)
MKTQDVYFSNLSGLATIVAGVFLIFSVYFLSYARGLIIASGLFWIASGLLHVYVHQ